MSETVCAVIVTYNRKNLLLECLEALVKQTRPLDGIYIIDNASTDGTPELLKEKGYIMELPSQELNEPYEKAFIFTNYQLPTTSHQLLIHYVRMPENTGSSGGFHEGIKRAYKEGYDWLWLMDDDGKPSENCLNYLLKFKEKANIIAPVVIDVKTKKFLSFPVLYRKKKYLNIEEIKKDKIDIIENFANYFNGILLNKNVVSLIGYPKKEFFAWGDEVEYYYRAKKNKIRIITYTKAEFFHPKNIGKHIKPVFNGKFGYLLTSKIPLRIYCRNRNYTYIYREYFGYIKMINFIIKDTIKRLLLWDLKNLYWSFKGFYDGYKKQFGKEKKFLK